MKDVYPLIEAEVEKRRSDILDLSHKVHSAPETAFEENRTSRLLQTILAGEGFAVSAGIGSLPTAFRAAVSGGGGRPRLALTAEMDALPGIGHACGHNIIAAAGVWSAVVLKSVLGPRLEGTIEVIGTPAEERGSGKVTLLEAGVFAGADAVLQMHPHAVDTVIGQAMARRTLTVEFMGKKAHAAAAPREGRNALNALVRFYHALVIQPGQLPAGCFIHGIIEEGGEAPNIIPDYARGRFSFRAEAMSKVGPGLERVREAALAAAEAEGCGQELAETGPAATTFKRNPVLEDLFAELFEYRGRPAPRTFRESYGSTDLANVSWVCPTIEVMLKASEHPIHSEAFAREAASAGGDRALLDGVFCLAAGGYRLLSEPDLLERVRESFRGADG